jgi:hypothetical protein
VLAFETAMHQFVKTSHADLQAIEATKDLDAEGKSNSLPHRRVQEELGLTPAGDGNG